MNIRIEHKRGNSLYEKLKCTGPFVNPLPIYSYAHEVKRSITGGYVYRGKAIPELCDTYLYGDFVNQAIWGLHDKDGKVVAHKTLYDPKSIWNLALDYFRDDGL